jgi:hypothetical protein
MKPLFRTAVLVALLSIAPNLCFAFWSVGRVSTAEAKELGMEIHAKAYGTNALLVELEFNAENKLKSFSHVELRVTEGEKPLVTATLKEDRPRPGHVAASFTSDLAQLNNITLWVFVADAMPGGTVYELRPLDFVDLKKLPHP